MLPIGSRIEQVNSSLPILHAASQTLLTPAEVARRLQVSVAWVRDHSTRKHPRLPVVRIGGLLRFCPADIDAWIQQQREIAARRAI